MEIIGQDFDGLNLWVGKSTLDITAKGRFWAADGKITRVEIAHAPAWTRDGGMRPAAGCTVLEADDLPRRGDRGLLARWELLTAALYEQFGHEIQETLPLDQSAYVPIGISARIG